MTSEDYIKWLDKSIEEALKYKEGLPYPSGEYHIGKHKALTDAKKLYLSILPPPQSTN